MAALNEASVPILKSPKSLVALAPRMAVDIKGS